MEKCSCYREYMSVGFDIGNARCFGTRECDPCLCGGDESKCDFYPEKRTKANKRLNTAEMWLVAQNDGEVYKTDLCETTYCKSDGFIMDEKYKYHDAPSLNSWMSATWHKQEKRKLTKAQAEKEFDIKIID